MISTSWNSFIIIIWEIIIFIFILLILVIYWFYLCSSFFVRSLCDRLILVCMYRMHLLNIFEYLSKVHYHLKIFMSWWNVIGSHFIVKFQFLYECAFKSIEISLLLSIILWKFYTNLNIFLVYFLCVFNDNDHISHYPMFIF